MIKDQKFNETFNLSWPIVAEMVVYTLITNVDMILMGKFGGNIGISSLALCNNIMNILVSVLLSMGISIATIALISNRLGKGNIIEAKKYSRNAIIMTFVMSVILSVFIRIFSGKILFLSGAREEIYSTGKKILQVNSLLIIIQMLTMITNSVLVAYGESKKSFFSVGIIGICKLFLNIIFIFSFNMQKLGFIFFSITSILANFAAFIYSTLSLSNLEDYKRIKTHSLFNISYMKRIIILSFPSSMEEVAFSLSRFIGTSIILHCGTLGYAANEIANNIEAFSVMPGIGIGIITTALVAYHSGKTDYRKIKKQVFINALAATGIMSTLALLFLLFPKFLVGIYIGREEKELINLTSTCLIIGALEQPFIAISSVFASALKGLRNTKTPFYISAFTAWGIRLPLIYYIIYKLKFYVTAVWWITALQWGIDALLMYIFFIKEIEKNKKS